MKRTMNKLITRLAVFIVVLAVLGTGLSWGQEEQNPAAETAKSKSGETAFYLSLAGTAVPTLIGQLENQWEYGLLYGFLGAYIGPSLGYFYGGLSGKGWNGILVRTACLAIWAVGYGIMPYAGFFGFLISAIYDIVTVWPRVEKHNTALRKQAFFISPFIAPQKKAFGISASIQF